MKTLADLLREDGAEDGDMYEAANTVWEVDENGRLFRMGDPPINPYLMELLPAEGWKRVSPRRPLREEFEQTVVESPGYIPAIYSHALTDLVGKRVRVTVEALDESVVE